MRSKEQQVITTPHCRVCRHFDGKAECRRVIDKRGKGLKVGFPDSGACLYFKPNGSPHDPLPPKLTTASNSPYNQDETKDKE